LIHGGIGNPRRPIYFSEMPTTEPIPRSHEAELRELVDEYRTRCLWFLRHDLYPETREEALRVLRQIERHADREGFIRAGRIRQWLSQDSSRQSVGF